MGVKGSNLGPADNRSRARVVGYALHFVAGLMFSLAYYAAFLTLGRGLSGCSRCRIARERAPSLCGPLLPEFGEARSSSGIE